MVNNTKRDFHFLLVKNNIPKGVEDFNVEN